MKALYFTDHGTTDNLRYGDLPTPQAQAGEVLVRVRAAALNHLDLWVLKGWSGLKLALPHIGGADVSGEVAALGSGCTRFAVGEAVVAAPGYLAAGPHDEWSERGEDSLSPRYRILGESRPGGFAEHIAVPEHALFPKPQNLTFDQAAAPLLAALTAWRMLYVRAALKQHESVLIVGAGGGVNSLALQLAKLRGARVFVLTGSDEKMDRAYALGAEQAINYRRTPEWAGAVRKLTDGRGVDVVVDNVGRATMAQSIAVLARGGRLVTVGNTSGPEVSFDNRYVFAKQLSIIGSSMGSRADFEEVLKLLASGKLEPIIHCVLPLADGRNGYDLLEQGAQFGKVVLRP